MFAHDSKKKKHFWNKMDEIKDSAVPTFRIKKMRIF